MKKLHFLIFLGLALVIVQTAFYYFRATEDRLFNVYILKIEWVIAVVIALLSFVSQRFFRFVIDRRLKRRINSDAFKYWFDSERKENSLNLQTNSFLGVLAIMLLAYIAITEIILNDKLPFNLVFLILILKFIFELSVIVIVSLKFCRVPGHLR